MGSREEAFERRVERLLEAKFEDGLHPRDRDGKFASKPGGELKKITAIEHRIAARATRDTLNNGGVTISLKGDVPTKGYAYAPDSSGVGYEKIVPKGEFTEATVESYMVKHHDLLSKDGNYLGAWEEDGNIYLDISRVGPPSQATIDAAQKAEQLAVFDLASFETITLGHKDANGKYVAHDVSYTEPPTTGGSS